MKAIEKIETALALEMLAYHKNYLANDLLQNKERSEEMQRLLSEALAELKKPPAEGREHIPPGPVAWNGKCAECNSTNFSMTIMDSDFKELHKRIFLSFYCMKCQKLMVVGYKYPDLYHVVKRLE